MARTKAFDIAELIRVFKYDSGTNKIVNTTDTKIAEIKSVSRATTDQFILDSFDKENVLAAKYVISMSKASKDYTLELLVSHNGSEAKMVQYAELGSDTLGVLSVGFNGSIVELKCTPSEVDVNIKFQRSQVDS